MGAALVLGAWACGEAIKGGGPSSTAGSGGGSTGDPASTSGAGGGPLTGPGDAGDPCAFDASPDGPDPPETPCGPASDAGACDLPPSVCANTTWLIYYVNPQCINGYCRWDKKTIDCPHCDCMNGGCTMNITAPAH